MLDFRDTTVYWLARLLPKLRKISIALAVFAFSLSPVTAQTLSAPDVPSSITPIPAPGFIGAKWVNTPSTNADFLKGKVVLVNFWATWCPPCIEELPSIQNLWASLSREDFEVVAVNVGENLKQVQNFLDRFDPTLDFAIVLDPNTEIYKLWKVSPLPTTYIVDRQNNWRYKGLGEFDFESQKIKSLIQQLIHEQSNSS